MIRFDEVTYAYPGEPSGRPAVCGVTLEVARGELVTVLGPNGSGKSTIARLTNGLLAPGTGEVTVDGIDTCDRATAWEIRSRVGLVFQNPDNQIVGTVVEEDVAFGPENLGVARGELRARVDRALETVGLSGLERREPHLLSGGQKQRLAIAGALAMEPAYLVLDEPTAMLDPRGRSDVLQLIDELRHAGRGIMHITHHLADMVRADRVIVMGEGAVAWTGTPGDLLGDRGLVDALHLRLPAAARLAEAFRELGVSVPAEAIDAGSLVEALWP
ncbi:MAG: energy-coupling factor transporter ATPase [Actinomycetota bacterium]|nr:energy-coupling factor transporter ATPase [Actinomycetota bacterium]